MNIGETVSVGKTSVDEGFVHTKARANISGGTA